MLIRPEKRFLFAYFIIIIALGSILLSLPFAWAGKEPLSYLDAIFTSTSAVCVTGLTTVQTADYTLFGKIIILILIQAGGMGIISFTTIYLIIPSRRMPIQQRKLIKDFSLDSIEYDPVLIMKKIILIMFSIEMLGAIILFIGFYPTLHDHAFFAAVFHSVSAFCNAGFSTFTLNLEGYVSNPVVNITIMGLIVLGGLGFMVLRDILKKIRRKKRLALHTKIVLITTFSLIIIGAVGYFCLEYNNAYKDLPVGEKIMASLFQSVTPRTAGFNTISQQNLTDASKFFTLPLMYIGASSGSTGGGIKTTTFFVVLFMAVLGSKRSGGVVLFKRKINPAATSFASAFMIKILMLLAICIFMLLITELIFFPGPHKNFLSIVFECFSAFGTVGLSLGATPELSGIAKIVLIFMMFEGKAGLISMALTTPESTRTEVQVDYPEGEVLIG